MITTFAGHSATLSEHAPYNSDDHQPITEGLAGQYRQGAWRLTAVPRRVLGQAGLWSRTVVAHYSRRAQRRRTDRVSLRAYPLRAPNNCAEGREL